MDVGDVAEHAGLAVLDPQLPDAVEEGVAPVVGQVGHEARGEDPVDDALGQKVVLCSPLTLFAMLGGARGIRLGGQHLAQVEVGLHVRRLQLPKPTMPIAGSM